MTLDNKLEIWLVTGRSVAVAVAVVGRSLPMTLDNKLEIWLVTGRSVAVVVGRSLLMTLDNKLEIWLVIGRSVAVVVGRSLLMTLDNKLEIWLVIGRSVAVVGRSLLITLDNKLEIWLVTGRSVAVAVTGRSLLMTLDNKLEIWLVTGRSVAVAVTGRSLLMTLDTKLEIWLVTGRSVAVTESLLKDKALVAWLTAWSTASLTAGVAVDKTEETKPASTEVVGVANKVDKTELNEPSSEADDVAKSVDKRVFRSASPVLVGSRESVMVLLGMTDAKAELSESEASVAAASTTEVAEVKIESERLLGVPVGCKVETIESRIVSIVDTGVKSELDVIEACIWEVVKLTSCVEVKVVDC